jgi:adhesin/invasin
VNAAQSTVVASHATVTACQTTCVVGTTASTVTVTARDQFTNPINLANVTLTSTGTSNSFAPSPSGTTNASGVFTATFSSTVAQGKTISAVANAVSITQTAALTVNPAAVSLANSLVSASDNSIAACSTSCTTGGNTASLITVTARDAFSNAIGGQAVSVACSVGTACAFTPASGSTNASGQFTSTFNSTLAQAKTIQGTVTSVGTITQTAAVTVSAAAASQIAVNGGNAQTARVGTAVLTDPSVIVRDAFNNPVPNVTVTFAVASGGGAPIAPTMPLTNASGIATVGGWTLGGTSADAANGTMANSLNASATGTGTATFTASAIYIFSGDVSPIVGPTSSCQGCHLASFTRNPNTLVGVIPNMAPCNAGGLPRVTMGDATNSVIYRKVSNTATCGGVMPPVTTGLGAAQLKIIRAWINNGAQDN